MGEDIFVVVDTDVKDGYFSFFLSFYLSLPLSPCLLSSSLFHFISESTRTSIKLVHRRPFYDQFFFRFDHRLRSTQQLTRRALLSNFSTTIRALGASVFLQRNLVNVDLPFREKRNTLFIIPLPPPCFMKNEDCCLPLARRMQISPRSQDHHCRTLLRLGSNRIFV